MGLPAKITEAAAAGAVGLGTGAVVQAQVIPMTATQGGLTAIIAGVIAAAIPTIVNRGFDEIKDRRLWRQRQEELAWQRKITELESRANTLDTKVDTAHAEAKVAKAEATATKVQSNVNTTRIASLDGQLQAAVKNLQDGGVLATPDETTPHGPDSNWPLLLLVEDHPGTAESMSTVFASIGFRIKTAATKMDAITMYDALLPAVVSLDLGLLDDDGIGVLKHIRAAGHPCRVVVTTGDPAREAEVRGAGADEFLEKPIRNVQRLIMAVQPPTSIGEAAAST